MKSEKQSKHSFAITSNKVLFLKGEQDEKDEEKTNGKV